MTDMPETIFVKRDVVMDDEGEWITCTPLRESFTRTDTIGAMLIEAERRGMMRAIKILELRPTRTERLGGQKFKYIQLGESIEEIRQAAAELEAKP